MAKLLHQSFSQFLMKKFVKVNSEVATENKTRHCYIFLTKYGTQKIPKTQEQYTVSFKNSVAVNNKIIKNPNKWPMFFYYLRHNSISCCRNYIFNVIHVAVY